MQFLFFNSVLNFKIFTLIAAIMTFNSAEYLVLLSDCLALIVALLADVQKVPRCDNLKSWSDSQIPAAKVAM